MPIDDIIQRVCRPGRLAVVFQPIIDVASAVHPLHALECLVRAPQEDRFAHAGELFDYVRSRGAEAEVDRACLRAIFRAAAALPAHPRLSINVHPVTLANGRGFAQFVLGELAEAGIGPWRVIVELVEHVAQTNLEKVCAGLEPLRAAGVAIAVDDIGSAQSNHRTILELRPDYLKIDRQFVHGCARDPARLAVVESVARLARYARAHCVAEGVEADEDLGAVSAVGVDLVQGYLFSPPVAAAALAGVL